MDYLWKGIQIGLLLAILMGPLLIALVQAGVEQGIRAGTAIGLGIWLSDLLFILGVYYGLSYVQQIVAWEYFSLTLGIAGSLILVIFGLGTLLSKPPDLDFGDGSSNKESYWKLWLKGFLINTINPFTVVFWLGLISSILLQENTSPVQAYLFLGGILGTIVFTDFAKVVLAKRIRTRLRPIHVLWLRRISGIALLVFGLGILIRVFV